MKAKYQEGFIKSYSKLPLEIQKIFEKKFELMKLNLRHPSLRIKKIRGYEDVFEGSINMQYRFTFHFIEDGIMFRKIGNHDETLDNP
jgi:mRNA interferase RelE/StbE